MAFDGVTVSAIVSELKKNLTGGRIYKIYQPEVDELCLVKKPDRTGQHNQSSGDLCRCQSASYLSDGADKGEPVDSPEFLYAATEAYWKCTHFIRDTAEL